MYWGHMMWYELDEMVNKIPDQGAVTANYDELIYVIMSSAIV